MYERIDIMTDIETLGNKENVSIIQLSAVAFDIRTNEKFDTFNMYVDINNATNLSVDGSTLIWWLNEERRNLLAEILTHEDKKGLKNVLYNFGEWVKGLDCDNKEKYLWGNGILFDNRIIQESMRKNGLEYPIFYRNDRDVRTILELASWKSGMTSKEIQAEVPQVGTKHNAIDDVLFQIELVHKCYKMLI
jgi:inhibitor of KinA sporulation pathway (predicted exonuclease)